jgi:hypothetical protein
LGHIEIGIIAAAVAGWIFKPDGTINENNWKKKVLPLAFGFMVLSYVSWFVQWTDHHQVNMSLSTMAIGFSSLMIFTFYKMEQVGFRAPILTPLGKNMLLVFIFSMLINELVYMEQFLIPFGLIGNTVWYGPLINLALAGIAPTILMWAIVWPMHRYNLVLKLSWPTGGFRKRTLGKGNLFSAIVSFTIITGIIGYGVYLIIEGVIFEAILCLLPLIIVVLAIVVAILEKKRN